MCLATHVVKLRVFIFGTVMHLYWGYTTNVDNEISPDFIQKLKHAHKKGDSFILMFLLSRFFAVWQPLSFSANRFQFPDLRHIVFSSMDKS